MPGHADLAALHYFLCWCDVCPKDQDLGYRKKLTCVLETWNHLNISFGFTPHPSRSADPSTGSGCCMVSLSNHHDEVLYPEGEREEIDGLEYTPFLNLLEGKSGGERNCINEGNFYACFSLLKVSAPTGQTLTHSPHSMHLDSARGLS